MEIGTLIGIVIAVIVVLGIMIGCFSTQIVRYLCYMCKRTRAIQVERKKCHHNDNCGYTDTVNTSNKEL